ncbi:MAG: FG-GAP-like repeat-containing protein [Bacteroidota bacterium]
MINFLKHYKIILYRFIIVFILIINTTFLFSQIPIINSFSPEKGKYYDWDTITGTGFHTNPDSNFVFFGSIKATVFSSSTTQLIVKVPRSAQSGPITITKSGLSTKSSTPFIIYKNGGSYADSSVILFGSFTGYVDYSQIVQENQIASGDFNLDNEIDFVETNSSGGSRVFLNSKTYQIANSFQSYISLSDSTGNKILGVADINNDGKDDIISINKTFKKIYYFKNNSTANVFSLSSPLIFNLTNSPRDFNINDFNNDGKLDLAITFDTVYSNTQGTVILLNTSTNSNTLLLSTPWTVNTLLGSKILNGDFNLDGKQDLIVCPATGSASNTIFLNNSTTSNISFIPFSFGFSASNKFQIGDFTLDGKIDFILHTDMNTYLFENRITGFSGSIVTYGSPIFLMNSSNSNSKFVDINMDGFSDFIVSNFQTGLSKIYLQNKEPDSLNRRQFSFSVNINSPYTTNSLILADLDTNYSQDMISYWNGLWIKENNFLKPQPTIKSSNVNIISIESFKAKFNVNKGNGSQRLVVLKKGSPITQLPVDYSNYLAKDSFGLGTSLETNGYIMYIGNKDTFTFNNLRRNTTYYAAVIEAHGLGLGANFMDSAYYWNFRTEDQISVQVSNVTVSNISDSSAKISWTKGDGNNRLVMALRDNKPNVRPIQNKIYLADDKYGDGDTIKETNGNINYIIYSDSGSYVYINGLSSSTTYNIRMLEYEVKADSVNYAPKLAPIDIVIKTLVKIPRIDSIVPLKAKPGDKVVIYGDYFDYDLMMNKVSYLVDNANISTTTSVTFGTVKASQFNIINKRTIEVIVPFGATNDFIRVTRKSLGDSYSPKKFQPYFLSKDSFGTGTYTFNSNHFSYNNGSITINGIASGDLNLDGRPDNYSSHMNGIAYALSPAYPNYSIELAFRSWSIAMTSQTSYRTLQTNFDVDRDLRMDLLSSSLTATGSFGCSNFSCDGGANPVGFSPGLTLGLTDFNKDGVFDRLVTRNNFNNNYSIFALGILEYNKPFLGWSSGNQNLTAATINDFNNDGKPDILFANKNTGAIRIYRNTYDTGFFNTSSFDTTLAISGPSGWENIESADINEDGKEDFAIINSLNNKLYIYKNISTGIILDSNSFVLTAVFSLPNKPNKIRLQDVSGDGKIDLIVSGPSTNETGLMIYKNNMVNQNIDTNNFKLYLNASNAIDGELKIADLNLDGKPEIIVNYGPTNYYEIMQNSQKLFKINPLKKYVYSHGDSLYLPYNTYGRTFNSGNLFKVQLLDSIGSTIINANIGQKTSSLSIDTLLCVLPANTAIGSYKLRIISTSPKDTAITTDFNISICQNGQTILLSSTKGFSICNYDSLNLTAGVNNLTGLYNWYRNNTLLTSTNVNSLTIKTAGQYKVVYKSSIGCSVESQTKQINTFNNSFSGYSYTGNTIFCNGDSVLVTVNSTHSKFKTYWNLNNNPLPSDSFNSIKITQSGNYNAIIIDSNYCKWSAPLFSTNSNNYAIALKANRPLIFCKGDSTLLIADSLNNADLRWRWYVNNILLQDSNNTLKITSSATVKLKSTNANGCIKYSNDTQVIVNSLPTGTLTGNKGFRNICSYDSLQLEVTTSANKFQWYKNGITLTLDTTSKLKIKTTGTYKIKLIDSNLCSNFLLDTLITFVPNKSPAIIFNKLPVICEGDSVVASSSIINGLKSFNWYYEGISQVKDTLPNLMIKQHGTYAFIIKDTFNCYYKSNDSILSVNLKPNIQRVVSSSNGKCLGDSCILIAQSLDTIQSYNWQRNGVDLNKNNKTITVKNNGVYNLKIINNKGCYSNSFDTSITFYSLPKVGFTTNRVSQCLTNNNFVFTDTTLNTTSIWNTGIGNTQTSKIANQTYANAGLYSVKLKSITTDGCIDSVTKTITVLTQPIVGIIINKDSQCLINNNFIFTDTTSNTTSIWNTGIGNIQTSKIANQTYVSAGLYTIKLKSLTTNGCRDSATKTVTVLTQPIAGFIINKDSQCLINNNFIFTDTTSNTTSTWNTGIGNIQTAKTAYQSYTNSGNYPVKLIVKSNNNCLDSISKNITINASPIIGNIKGPTSGIGLINPIIYSINKQVNHTYKWIATNGDIVSGQGTDSVTILWKSLGTGKVYTEIKNTQDCSDTTSLNVNITNLSLHNISNNTLDWQIYPNPNNGHFTLKLNNKNLTNIQLKLINMLGQEVWSINKLIIDSMQELEFDANLSKGVYLIQLQTENGSAFKNIIIQ